jgi:peptidyl-prolyl cis-trans isomerase C
MVPEFSDAAFGMTVGDISPIVETKFGYHIIKVTDHQAAGVQSLSEVKDQLQGYLTAQKKREALVAYIEELKKNADVVSQRQDFDAGAEQ